MLFRNASWSAIVSAYRSGVALLSTFLAVRLLGSESYGNIAALISVFALCLSLISGVFIVLVAKLMAPDNHPGGTERNVLFAAAGIVAGTTIVLILSLASLLASWAAELKGYGVLNDAFWDYAHSGSIMLGILTTIQILSLLNSAMIESAGRLDASMKSQMLGPSVVLAGLLLLFLLQQQAGVITYLLLLCTGATVDMLVLWVVRRTLVQERLLLNHLRLAVYRIPDLLKSGSAIQVSAFLNIFLEPLNKLVLNQFAGSSSVTSYDLAMKIIWGLQGLFGAVMRIFLHLSSHGAEIIARTYVRVLTLIAVPTLAAHSLGALFLSYAIHYWIKVEQDEMMVFLAIATLSNLAMIYITPLYLSLIAHDDRYFLFQNQLRLTLCNIVASLLLIPVFGLVGAAVGLCCAAIYNMVAIYNRFQKVVGPIGGIQHVVTERRWTFLLATTLLIGSLLTGANNELNQIAVVGIAATLLLLCIKEPIMHEVLHRVTNRQENKH